MNTQRFERRKALWRAGLLGAGLFTGLAPRAAQADQGHDTPGIEGAWLILVRPQGAQPYEVLNLYTVGGGVAGDSAHDPATGSSAYGAWRKAGDHQFQITFMAFTFDRASGEWTGGVKIRARAPSARKIRHSAGRLG